MLEQLRQRLRALEKPAGIDGRPGRPAARHRGDRRGARRRPRARRAARDRRGERGPSRRGDRLRAGAGGARTRTHTCWIAEDMALAESGAPYGPGLDAFGLAPERLLTVAAARPRDLLWAMEEALRCRAVGAVIGEWRHGDDRHGGGAAAVARGGRERRARAAAARRARRTTPPPRRRAGSSARALRDDMTALLRRAARAQPPRPAGSWILEWSDSDERFLLATPAQPVAAPALDRPHRQGRVRFLRRSSSTASAAMPS